MVLTIAEDLTKLDGVDPTADDDLTLRYQLCHELTWCIEHCGAAINLTHMP